MEGRETGNRGPRTKGQPPTVEMASRGRGAPGVFAHFTDCSGCPPSMLKSQARIQRILRDPWAPGARLVRRICGGSRGSAVNYITFWNPGRPNRANASPNRWWENCEVVLSADVTAGKEDSGGRPVQEPRQLPGDRIFACAERHPSLTTQCRGAAGGGCEPRHQTHAIVTLSPLRTKPLGLRTKD